MSGSTLTSIEEDSEALRNDADQRARLKRVSFVEGMMLGLEATRDEQDYHRRRLNRHHGWMHGVGTVAGLAVSVEPAPAAGADPQLAAPVQIVVAPGVAIDGLGRELTVDVRHCLDLAAWLVAADEPVLNAGYAAAQQRLFLKVVARYQHCRTDLTPVLARQLDASTDAVDYGRLTDGFQLELVVDDTQGDASLWRPGPDGLTSWQRTLPTSAAATSKLSAPETTRLNAAADVDKPLLALKARLLHAYDTSAPTGGLGSEPRASLLDMARIPLASVVVDLASLANRVVNPSRVQVDNFVRPFALPVNTAALLAAQQP